MDERVILQVLADQREELDMQQNKMLCSRKEEELFEWDSHLAQVVIGVRRSGKSTLCHKVLRDRGIKYGYVDFDDDRLANLKIDDLNSVLSCIYQLYGTDVQYLFMDEVQNVDGWYLFVNRLLRQSLHILLTGSNAKLLSGELATHLTGRYNEIRLFPFSFSEYLEYNGIDKTGVTTKAEVERKTALDEYLMEGGMPELIHMKNDRTKRIYIEGLVETILRKDIAVRYKIRNIEGLRRLANHLINNTCQVIDYQFLAELTGIKSENTVRKYVGYLSQAYLVQKIQKFSYKSKERICNEKVYVVDTGFIANRENSLLSKNWGWRLENAVYTEIRRRYLSQAEDVYYYKEDARSKELDFVICRQGVVVELIQVAYSISDKDTYKREMDALVQVAKKLKCFRASIITLDESREVVYDNMNVHIYNAVEWLNL